MMNPEMEKKHEMMQKLLDMLKTNAVNEMEPHIHPPMPEEMKGGKPHEMSVEKVSVSPADDMEKMADGGAVSEEPSLADSVMNKDSDPTKKEIMASPAEEDLEMAHEHPMDEESENESAFNSFLTPRRKLKK